MTVDEKIQPFGANIRVLGKNASKSCTTEDLQDWTWASLPKVLAEKGKKRESKLTNKPPSRQQEVNSSAPVTATLCLSCVSHFFHGVILNAWITNHILLCDLNSLFPTWAASHQSRNIREWQQKYLCSLAPCWNSSSHLHYTHSLRSDLSIHVHVNHSRPLWEAGPDWRPVWSLPRAGRKATKGLATVIGKTKTSRKSSTVTHAVSGQRIKHETRHNSSPKGKYACRLTW